MLCLKLEEDLYTVTRHCAVLDTFLLREAFLPSQAQMADAKGYLEAIRELRSLVIPVAVLVETWGWIAAKFKRPDLGAEFLQWAHDRRNGITILPTRLIAQHEVVRMRGGCDIDLVDAYVIAAYFLILDCSAAQPDVVLVSSDLRDLPKAANWTRRSIICCDPLTDEDYTINPKS